MNLIKPMNFQCTSPKLGRRDMAIKFSSVASIYQTAVAEARKANRAGAKEKADACYSLRQAEHQVAVAQQRKLTKQPTRSGRQQLTLLVSEVMVVCCRSCEGRW